MSSHAPIVIIGAAGSGRESADVAEAAGVPIHGILDDSPRPEDLQLLARRGLAFLGSVDDWLSQRLSFPYVIGISSGHVKEAISTKMDHSGQRAVSLVHPTASIGSDCRFEAGTVIFAGVRITTNVRLGRHVHLNQNVTVGHDTTVGDHTSVNPSSSLAGGLRIGERVLIGSGANVLQYLKIGDDVTVGASALVTKDLPAGVIAKGVPARW